MLVKDNMRMMLILKFLGMFVKNNRESDTNIYE
jgi:hypothetical protein